jgi:NTE family protein
MEKQISLVLSSGGARGVAHIGVIKELEKQGFEIKSIAGTSMGALVGGMYATGELDVYKEWMCSLDKMDVFNLIDFTFSKNGIMKGDKILREMKRIIPDRNIEDLPIPFVAVATDISNDKDVVFNSGSLYDAIRASISIPTVFTPFVKDESYIVDGGVLNPIPINRVKRVDDDILVVVNVNARIPNIKPPLPENNNHEEKRYSKYINTVINKLNYFIPKHETDKLGYFSLLNKTMGLMLHQISLMTLEKYQPDILINVSRDSFGTYDFYKSEKLIEAGRKATIEAINNFKTIDS